MSARVTRDRAATGGRGFTLIEVLLATFVIALGVLGLLALFAGAARQQQSASQTTVSVVAAKNAESLLLRSLGSLNVGTLALTNSVWYPLPMNSKDYYLSVNPEQAANGPSFEVPGTDLPRTLYTDPEGLPPGVAAFINGAPFGPSERSKVADFGQRRLKPESVQLLVTTSDEDNMERQLPYFRKAVQGNDPQSETTNGLYAFYFGGDSVMFPDDYIVVDVQPLPDGTLPASIYRMKIGDVANAPSPPRYVKSIEVTSFSWLNDQLVSLSNRTIRRPDASSPTGDRPDMAYSLLYRVTPTNSQIVVFTYQLVPDSANSTFIPPERRGDYLYPSNIKEKPPLRLAALRLGYDPARQKYFVTPQESEEESLWAMEPGQVLMLAGDREFTTPNPPPTARGADAPVQVVSKVKVVPPTGGAPAWRAYLDRGPRTAGDSMLTAEQRTRGWRADVLAFAVNDVVTSLAPDRSKWRLKPLEARVFQVPNN